MPSDSSIHDRIRDIVRTIPPGRVATYGQIATIVGRCTPRLVGYAMAGIPFGSDVPWHRVVNSEGRISRRRAGDGAIVQRRLLETEGIRFDGEGRVDLGDVGWRGPGTGK